MNRTISVIVPVYNTYSFLPKCVNSILSQSYLNLEIILVDDGSTDGSGELCDRYRQKDQRVKVIHQLKAGVTEARKQGLKASTGTYVAFIDSDDYIETEMFQVLEQIAEEKGADLVTSGYVKETPGKEGLCFNQVRQDAFREGIYNQDRKYVYENMMCYDKYSLSGILPTLCSKLFKRNLVEKNIDRIPASITIAEDACLTYMCCMDADCICVTHKVFYHYNMRDSSRVHTIERKCFSVLNDCYECLYQKISEMQEYQNELIEQLQMFIARENMFCLKERFGFSNRNMLPFYMVCMEGICSDTRLVLYGAGNVGSSYYKQITALKQADIVLWVDSNEDIVRRNLCLSPVQEIQKTDYDYILIAIKDQKQVFHIIQILENMGIEQTKIIWREPQFILDVFHISSSCK